MEKINDVFMRFQRYGIFATVMSSIETNLLIFCSLGRKLYGWPENFNPKSPAVFRRAVDYIQKNSGISLHRHSRDLELIRHFQRLRNCILHSGGTILKRKDESLLREFIDKIPTLLVDSRDRIILLEGFVPIVLNISIHFFDILLYEIKRQMQNK